jgi:hypothetical protein
MHILGGKKLEAQCDNTLIFDVDPVGQRTRTTIAPLCEMLHLK